MKFITTSAVGALMLIGFAAPAMAQSANATAAGSITVYQPLSVAKDTDLAFGTVVRPATGTGSVTVGTDSARSALNGVVPLASTFTAAKFTVSGEGTSLISISIPGTATLSNGSATLTVATSNDVVNPASTALSGSLGSTGTTSFHVGGTIAIADTTANGAYNGSFQVTATYN